MSLRSQHCGIELRREAHHLGQPLILLIEPFDLLS
jgi:hypothetical protein